LGLGPRIAVFAGDFFWTSAPYESLDVHEGFCKHFECDYLIFKNDIRLNKIFYKQDKFYFDKERYKSAANMRVIEDWNHFAKISSEYDLILVSTHIAPKTRWPFGNRGYKHFKSRVATKIVAWDIGGADILTNAVDYADYFFTKGDLWTEWLTRMGKMAYTTGAPQYDYFLDEFDLDNFYKKYSIDKNKETILVLPSNPGSSLHNNQMKENMDCLDFLSKQNSINLLFKTYPNDYLFHESDAPYTGVYRRWSGTWGGPQYNFFEDRYPAGAILESQDHHVAMKCADKIFNIAGSHVSWETLFTNSKSFTMNYSNKPYFRRPKYLPEFVNFPDSELNYEIQTPEMALLDFQVQKEKCGGFILKEYSIPNMIAAINKILGDE
jgi:hypothetical protein